MNHPARSRLALLLFPILAVLPSGAVRAATYAWDTVPGTVGAGNGVIDDGSGTWDTANGNWTGDSGLSNVAWASGTNDTAEFGGSAGGTVTLSGSLAAGGISFSGAGANSYTIAGTGLPTLTLGAGGIRVAASAGAQSFDSALGLSLASGQTWDNAAAGLLTIDSPVSAAAACTLTIGGAGSTTIGGILADGAGVLSLTKSGAGTLTLTGANTYSGATAAAGGILRYAPPNASPAASSITVSGGEIRIDDGVVLRNTSGAFLFSASGAIRPTTTTGALANTSGTPFTVTVGPGATATIATDFTVAGIGSEANPALVMSGGGNLILGGAAIVNYTVNTKGYVSWDGGGTLTISGTLNNQYSGSNAQSDKVWIGNSSSNNTVHVTGQLLANSVYVGNATFGGNVLSITDGASCVCNHNNIFVIIGGSSSSNRLTIAGGATMQMNKGNGTNNNTVGDKAGASRNVMSVTGTGSRFTSTAPLTIGNSGSSNRLGIAAGGVVNPQRLLIGAAAGASFNSAVLEGAGSSTTVNSGANSVFQVGAAAGTVGNSLTIRNTAWANFTGTGANRSFGIGVGNGAHSNAVTVTGAGSLLTVSHAQPLTLGGQIVNSTVTDSTAADNRLDILSGAGANLAAVCVYLMGVRSSFNLGDGTGLSVATVGKSSGYPTTGVYLGASDARLNINAGLLRSSVAGSLVSGPGAVSVNGPAYVSTTNANGSIDSAITGTGDLIKIDPGMLTLSGTNTLSGSVVASNGVLRLTHVQCLSADTSVRIWSGGSVDLAYAGTDTIKELYIDGVLQYRGVYGHAQYPSLITGTGYLRARTGGVPSGFLLIIR